MGKSILPTGRQGMVQNMEHPICIFGLIIFQQVLSSVIIIIIDSDLYILTGYH